jgi:cytoskeletal protein RodZ
MDSSDKEVPLGSDQEVPLGAPPVVPLSNEGGALAQFLPGNSANKTTAPAISAEPDDVTLGQVLRRARVRRGLTLPQISYETKIPRRHLEALEQGNLAELPGGFYLRAEVRAYAEMVHVDPNDALARLERALQASSASSARHAALQTQPAEAPARVTGKALTATGVLAAALLIWFVVSGRSTSAPESPGSPGSPGNNIRAGSVTQTQKPEGPAVQASSVTQTQEPDAPAPPEPDSPAPAAQVPVNASAGTSGQGPNAHAAAPSRFVEAGSSPSPVDRPATESAESNDGSSLQSNSDGELTVTTEPAGGRVTIDGIGWGTTPVTIRNLPPGPKHVRVTKDGYGVEERVVSLAPNRSTITLQIPLRSVP